MPSVTAIKQQKHNASRFSIFLDGAYSLSVRESALVASGLHIGQELSKAELQKLVGDLAKTKLYDQALNLLSFRRRSYAEMRRYLKDKTDDVSMLEELLQRLQTQGWLDDD